MYIKNIIIVTIVLSFFGCEYPKKESGLIGDRCLYVDEIDDIVCSENVLDSNLTYYIIGGIENRELEIVKSEVLDIDYRSEPRGYIRIIKFDIVCFDGNNLCKFECPKELLPRVGDDIYIICDYDSTFH